MEAGSGLRSNPLNSNKLGPVPTGTYMVRSPGSAETTQGDQAEPLGLARWWPLFGGADYDRPSRETS